MCPYRSHYAAPTASRPRVRSQCPTTPTRSKRVRAPLYRCYCMIGAGRSLGVAAFRAGASMAPH
eukprot:2837750-Alexandrium_andersonii.AAC.1